MWPYILTLFAATSTAMLARTSGADPGDDNLAPRPIRRVVVLSVAFFFLIMTAFRVDVGADYWPYVRNYFGEYREPITVDGIFSEPGIRMLTHLSTSISDTSATFFLLAALLTILPIIITLERQSPYFALSIFLFVTTSTWQDSLNAVRQMIACAIVFAGFSLVRDRKFAPYLLLVIGATAFHGSALLLILVYFVPRKRLSGPALFLWTLGAVALSQSYELFTQLLVLTGNDHMIGSAYFEHEINPLRVLVALAPYLFYRAVSVPPENRQGHLLGNLLLINCLVYFVALNSAYLARFTLYTEVYTALALPVVISVISDPRVRLLAMWSTMTIYFVLWYIETSGASHLVPYQWVFSG